MFAQPYDAGGVLLTLTDEEYNTVVLGLDALIDEYDDLGKPEGFEWVAVARRMRQEMGVDNVEVG